MGLVIVGSVFAADADKGAGKGAGMRPTMGEITKVDGTALTVKGTSGEQTFTLAADAEITKEVAAKVGDLKVGDRVRITQGEKRAYGEVTKIDGNAVTVKGRSGQDETITVDDKTTIMVRVPAKAEDLKVGVKVMAFVADGKASRVSIVETLPQFGGGEKGKGERGKGEKK
jgi:pyruvate carboxylase